MTTPLSIHCVNYILPSILITRISHVFYSFLIQAHTLILGSAFCFPFFPFTKTHPLLIFPQTQILTEYFFYLRLRGRNYFFTKTKLLVSTLLLAGITAGVGYWFYRQNKSSSKSI